MHIAQDEFARGEVKLTLDYRTDAGTRRVTLIFTGDDIGMRDLNDEAPMRVYTLTKKARNFRSPYRSSRRPTACDMELKRSACSLRSLNEILPVAAKIFFPPS